MFQTTLICVSSGLESQSFWFSYILFLIFLGGILVLFIYVASLASNEPFKFSLSTVFVFLNMIFVSIIFIIVDNLCVFFNVKISIPALNISLYNDLSLIRIIYSSTTIVFTLYLVIYLLLTLFAIVKITKTHFGPLRLSSYDYTLTKTSSFI